MSTPGHADPNISAHRRIRLLAIEHDLDLTQLNAICQVTVGSPLNRLTPDQARFVLTTMVAKGPAMGQWAQELTRSL